MTRRTIDIEYDVWTVTDFKRALGKLSKRDLEEVLSYTKSLSSTDRSRRAKPDSDALQTYDLIADAVRRRLGGVVVPWHIAAARNESIAVGLTIFHTDLLAFMSVSALRGTKVAELLYRRRIIEFVIDMLDAWQVPVTVRNVMIHSHHIPNAVDLAFPGYAACNRLPFAFASFLSAQKRMEETG